MAYIFVQSEQRQQLCFMSIEIEIFFVCVNSDHSERWKKTEKAFDSCGMNKNWNYERNTPILEWFQTTNFIFIKMILSTIQRHWILVSDDPNVYLYFLLLNLLAFSDANRQINKKVCWFCNLNVEKTKKCVCSRWAHKIRR